MISLILALRRRNEHGEVIDIKKGVKYERPLRAMLFNICIDQLLRRLTPHKCTALKYGRRGSTYVEPVVLQKENSREGVT
jgi:hypothetical protein